MIEINRHPSPRDLRIFSALLPLLFFVLGALRWHAGSTSGAQAWWITGAGVTLVVLVSSKARRWLYVGWIYAAYPIAWTVSHLLLAIAFFLIATPVGLLLRLLRRDPMNRSFDRAAATYWTPHEPKRDAARYFRQF